MKTIKNLIEWAKLIALALAALSIPASIIAIKFIAYKAKYPQAPGWTFFFH